MRLLLLFPLLAACAPVDRGSSDDDDSAFGDDDDATAAGPECDTFGLEVGDCPPDFELPSTAGGQVHPGDFPGERVVVLGTSNW